MRAGQLIVFEGAEGAGKSTQHRLVAERLKAAGADVLALREPGGTPLGDAIRSLVLDSADSMEDEAEVLLFLASRAELVRREIDPALARGVVVLMDRFFLSTYAYQIHGRGLPEEAVRSANALATGGLTPDLTLIVDLPPSEGLARASARGGHDRIERSGDDFFSRVGSAFTLFASDDWQRTHPECGPIVRVDGQGTPGEVFERVSAALARNLPDRFAMTFGTGRA